MVAFSDRVARALGWRDPQAATQVMSYQARGLPQIEQWSAEDAYNKGYILDAFVFAAVRAIAQDVASLPFRVADKAPDDPTEEQDYNSKLPLALLLGPPPGGPSPLLSARKLWAWSVAQRLITGRMAWEIEYAGSKVVALWPLLSRLLSPIPVETGPQWFSGFEFGTGTSRKRLAAEQVFYSWIPSQNDFRQAESPLQAARIPIDLAVMINKYDHAFIRNDAVPASMITHQRIDDDDDRRSWRQKFLGANRGPDNAGGVVFNEVEPDSDGKIVGTIAIERLGLTQSDAQFAQRYTSSIQAICVGLGVPLSRLMDASGRTFSNAEGEYVNYWTSTIKPLVSELADDVNTQLAPKVGPGVGWFDMSGVPGLITETDRPYAIVGLPALVKSGIVTQVWAAEQVGAPTDGLLTTAIHPLAEQFLSSGLNADGTPRPLALQNPVREVPPVPVTRAEPVMVIESSRQTPLERVTERAVREAKAVPARVGSFEKAWGRAFNALFRRQESAAIARLQGSRGRQVLAAARNVRAESFDASSVFDPALWEDATRTLAVDLFVTLGDQAALRVVELVSPESEPDAAIGKVAAALESRANELAGEVTSTTYDGIRKALIDGAAAGEGVDEIGRRVRDVFDAATTYRGELIARTEVNRAYNQAALVAASEFPEQAYGKSWLATVDSRTRKEHAEADGQARLLAEPFSVGGKTLDAPGEPNCRCTVLILDEDEYREMKS